VRAALFWMGIAGGLLRCAPEEIVVADRDGQDLIIDGVSSGVPCGPFLECGADEYCARRGCGSTPGVCERRPSLASCDADDTPPVCGCDGLLYLNDCLRRARGVVAAPLEECFAIALLCGGPLDPSCPGDSFCGKLLPANAPLCPFEATGRCWVLPECGPDPVGVERWAACGQGTGCVDTCSAIQSETPHVPVLCGTSSP
jgi:hypothetical protein